MSDDSGDSIVDVPHKRLVIAVIQLLMCPIHRYHQPFVGHINN
jgi:hypothetical protein